MFKGRRRLRLEVALIRDDGSVETLSGRSDAASKLRNRGKTTAMYFRTRDCFIVAVILQK